MSTGWVETVNAITQDREIKITISRQDLLSLKLDEWDKKLLEDCSTSPSIADRALVVEMLLRRIAQQRPKESK